MATINRVLQLLETGEVTLEEATEAIGAFERAMARQRVETSTCMFCGQPYIVSEDKPVVSEQGRRSVCWRRACRQELRARGLGWGGHHLYRRLPAFPLRH